ncbi:hypothetical protein GCM10010168_81060 [Actinoplanes ianthinogenes]|uniref:Nephrocystin 3-like N-terminal domain-containing protein n=1 Tax=Actinoplanes ianthinogenes TaxID=122358 RepID=A0ABN6C503_9ACTN|nr:hypothetical protein [Actinoplanes ianthinogenes]BCJ40560.1 hypothetical protein Aiant_12170 [Actinoplanes ianthinogenes]GGR50087.1 hypothetical protein GCM10010168_81060 [Actinoplanes ianthinogenes]
MTAPSAADEFWTRLRELYRSAKSPDLATLVRQGAAQQPPVMLNDATLSEWLNGESIPSKGKERAFKFLVGYLEGRAGLRDERELQRRIAEWWRHCADARRSRRAPSSHIRTGDSAVVARSIYIEQLRQQIAPPELVGRSAELAELADFASGASPSAYVWWQAGPWAGKTALLATFVADPPEDFAGRVWVVAFFITARLAGQDTRGALTETLTQQLCQLLGQEVPLGLSDVTREGALLDLFAQAAANRVQAGGSLVLVVDGLDEDRSVTTGAEARSIAGLLPGRPPEGMRVIVTGRPNPPVPDDVPDWHPLRDKRNIRQLLPSPSAQNLRRLGRAELKRLLTGSSLEQDVLGLLTAARGGLTASDLSELTGAGLVEIEDVLHTAAGRTFIRRAGTLSPVGDQVYLLGHEELQVAAVSYLGRVREAHYRNQLHSWADGYRAEEPAWPRHTPEYLLLGYPRLLIAVGDGDRLARLATDPVRHDLLLELSGGDAVALAEIKTCEGMLLAGDRPDLGHLALLSYQRHRLVTRNANIPAELPAVWAMLGNPTRGEALARGITNPHAQADALIGLARLLAAADDHDRARIIAADAEQVISGIANAEVRSSARAGLATAVAALGDRGWAQALSENAAREAARRERHGFVGRYPSTAGVSGYDRVLDSVPRFTAEYWRAEDLIDAIPEAGDPRRIRMLVDDARRAVLLVGNLWSGAELRKRLIRALPASADRDTVRSLIAGMRSMIHDIAHPDLRREALVELVRAVIAAGDLESGVEIVRQGSRRAESPRTAIALWKELAASGDRELVRAMADDMLRRGPALLSGMEPEDHRELVRLLIRIGARDKAEEIVRSMGPSAHRDVLLAELIKAIALAGNVERAVELADGAVREARDRQMPAARARLLIELVRVLPFTGSAQLASHLVVEAGQAIDLVADFPRARLMVSLVEALAVIGKLDLAGEIAGDISEPKVRTDAMSGLAQLRSVVAELDRNGGWIPDLTWTGRIVNGSTPDQLAQAAKVALEEGSTNLARALAVEAERVARAITNRDREALALVELVRALAGVDDLDRAEDLAGRIADPDRRALARVDVARAKVRAGDFDEAESLIHAIPFDSLQRHGLAGLAGAMARAGDCERAESVARGIAGPFLRAKALSEVSLNAARSGFTELADRIADTVSDPYLKAVTLAGLAEAAGGTQDQERARRLVVAAEQAAVVIVSPYQRVRALAARAQALAALGDRVEAQAVIAGVQEVGDPGGFETSLLGSIDSTLQGRAEFVLAVVLSRIGVPGDAKRIASGISRCEWRAQALAHLSCAAAEVGDSREATSLFRAAEDAVSKIEDSGLRVQTLADLAVIVGPDRADRLLAEAYATGPWWLSASATAHCRPEVIVRLVDAVTLSLAAPHSRSGTGSG